MKRVPKQRDLPGIEKHLYKEKLARTRAQLVARLQTEGEDTLAKKLEGCGREMTLMCGGCHHRRTVNTRCKATWCPACQPAIAAARKCELQPIVSQMRWPLFVTLTCINTPTAAGVRGVVKAFAKLRRKKIWLAHVRGGVAGYEITNKGNGWHPHVHMVIDCEWLAFRTPAPKRGTPRQEVERLCKEAQQELCVEWAKCLKQPGMAWAWVKRCKSETILNEVAKYAIMGEDLVSAEGSSGELIRAIQATRMMTTFGKAYKRKPKEKREPQPCPGCGEFHGLLPEALVAAQALWSARKDLARRPRRSA